MTTGFCDGCAKPTGCYFCLACQKSLREELAGAREENGRLLTDMQTIRDKWVPALRRDAIEADKTLCNAESIYGVVVRAIALEALKKPEGWV